MRHGILYVCVDEAVRVDAPLFHSHRADQLAREPRFCLQRLLGRQSPMGVSLFERLEAVVDLHRRLHPLDVVPVVRQHRDEEDDSVHEVARDRNDVSRVLRGQSRGVPVELEVARASVDHPARSAGGAGAPVALVHQQHRQASQREVARDARAGHAAADHADVVSARCAQSRITLEA